MSAYLPLLRMPRRIRIETKFAMHVAIDDSDSIGASDFVCLAALGGQQDNWEMFAQRWGALLNKHSLSFLHTADFLTGNGPYKIYGEKRADVRRKIVGEFAELIAETVPYSYAIAIHKPAYDAFVKGVPKRINAQSMCFARVVARIVGQFKQGLIDEPITFLVDDSAKQSQHILSLWQSLRKNHAFAREMTAGICFGDDRYWSMIQGADLLANSVVQELRRGEDAFSGNSPIRVMSSGDKPGIMLFESEVWRKEDIEANGEMIRTATVSIPA